uniref:Uncharacterized protein n=1 Tax=uncultured marine group II/III euryarchaeote KM3_195_B08 TaxID=1457970 RepID=A0A075GUZ0_9EURY|nr:hypothetical protein [uncultured marine group II/III euryarchaeote KM3_195_B08]
MAFMHKDSELQERESKALSSWSDLQPYLKKENWSPRDVTTALRLWADVQKGIDAATTPQLKTLKSTIQNHLNKTSISMEMSIGDKLFCLKLLSTKNTTESLSTIHSWVRTYGQEKSLLISGPLHIQDDNPTLRFIGKKYATFVLGKEKRVFLQKEAGIRNFLRYPPQVLHNTYTFLNGGLTSGKVVFYLGATTDYNGAFYQNIIDFQDASAAGYKIIAMEAYSEKTFLAKMQRFVDQLKTTESIQLNTIMFSAHGYYDHLNYGSKPDETSDIAVSDVGKKLFENMSTIFGDYKFKQAFIFSCYAGGKKSPGFVNIGSILKDTGIAHAFYASPTVGRARLRVSEGSFGTNPGKLIANYIPHNSETNKERPMIKL